MAVFLRIFQEEVCPGWATMPQKVLSFGCSVGLEIEDNNAPFFGVEKGKP